jgi:hypothetical protein
MEFTALNVSTDTFVLGAGVGEINSYKLEKLNFQSLSVELLNFDTFGAENKFVETYFTNLSI